MHNLKTVYARFIYIKIYYNNYTQIKIYLPNEKIKHLVNILTNSCRAVFIKLLYNKILYFFSKKVIMLTINIYVTIYFN